LQASGAGEAAAYFGTKIAWKMIPPSLGRSFPLGLPQFGGLFCVLNGRQSQSEVDFDMGDQWTCSKR
jgi:hypothetical protein